MSGLRYQLPDGRWIRVNSFSSPPETTELGPLWEISVEEGSNEEVVVGHPLKSSVADALGYRVGFQEWPAWIDELAHRIEQDFAGHDSDSK